MRSHNVCCRLRTQRSNMTRRLTGRPSKTALPSSPRGSGWRTGRCGGCFGRRAAISRPEKDNCGLTICPTSATCCRDSAGSPKRSGVSVGRHSFTRIRMPPCEPGRQGGSDARHAAARSTTSKTPAATEGLPEQSPLEVRHRTGGRGHCFADARQTGPGSSSRVHSRTNICKAVGRVSVWNNAPLVDPGDGSGSPDNDTASVSGAARPASVCSDPPPRIGCPLSAVAGRTLTRRRRFGL